MFKINFKKFLLNFGIISTIFLTDRLTKIYILKIAEVKNTVDIYVNTYLNFYLIWNKGIAFGLFSFDEQHFYNILSLIISGVIIILVGMMIKSRGLKRYSLLMIIGGALGNLHDRIFTNAVPDFIDFHVGAFHWFIFNVSDIFISLGIVSMIVLELINNDKKI